MDGSGDGSNRDATPRFVVFGRTPDTVASLPAMTGQVTPPPAPPVPPGPLPPTPPEDGGPITDVNTLPVVSPEVAAQIKTAAGLGVGPAPELATSLDQAPPALEIDKPGTERWPVKTGQDPDRAKVGKNVIGEDDLGAGIVEATVEDLIGLPRACWLGRR
jgi:hypothetical protein